MTTGMRTLIVPVKELGPARELYATLLGVAPYTDQPYYVGFRVGDQEVGLDPNGHRSGMAGPVGYWHVTDIEAAVAGLVGRGAVVTRAVSNVGNGRMIATVEDGDGNPIGLLQDPA